MNQIYKYVTLVTLTAIVLIGLLAWPGLATGSVDAAPIRQASASQLQISKAVSPPVITRNDAVTYTISLTRTAVTTDATDLILTDTLPISTTFSRWVARPAGAGVTADVLTWAGQITGGQVITFSFVAGHTGGYDEWVTNRVTYSSTVTGTAAATFRVRRQPFSYLPLIAKSKPLNSMARFVLQQSDVPAGYIQEIDGTGVMTFTPEVGQFNPVEGYQSEYINSELLFSGPFWIDSIAIKFQTAQSAHAYMENAKRFLASEPGSRSISVPHLGDRSFAYQVISTEGLPLVVNLIVFQKGRVAATVQTGGFYPVAADYNFTLSLARIVEAKMGR